MLSWFMTMQHFPNTSSSVVSFVPTQRALNALWMLTIAKHLLVFFVLQVLQMHFLTVCWNLIAYGSAFFTGSVRKVQHGFIYQNMYHSCYFLDFLVASFIIISLVWCDYHIMHHNNYISSWMSWLFLTTLQWLYRHCSPDMVVLSQASCSMRLWDLRSCSTVLLCVWWCLSSLLQSLYNNKTFYSNTGSLLGDLLCCIDLTSSTVCWHSQLLQGNKPLTPVFIAVNDVGLHLIAVDTKVNLCYIRTVLWMLIRSTLCSEKKNTRSHFLLYLHEWCVDLNKNCSKYTQGMANSENVEIRYSLGPMTSLWRHICKGL